MPVSSYPRGWVSAVDTNAAYSMALIGHVAHSFSMATGRRRGTCRTGVRLAGAARTAGEPWQCKRARQDSAQEPSPLPVLSNFMYHHRTDSPPISTCRPLVHKAGRGIEAREATEATQAF